MNTPTEASPSPLAASRVTPSPSGGGQGELPKDRYSAAEERVNSLTHAVGVLLSLVGIGWMLSLAWSSPDPWQLATVLVFGVCLIALYLASSLYHGVSDPKQKRLLHLMDHVGIYLLIAGTYTPIALVGMQGAWGKALCAVIWSLAILGIVFEAFWVERPRWSSVVIYVAMGWMAVIAVGPMREALSSHALWLIFGGGAVYTGGTLFYLLKYRYSHAVWHLFVIGGSALHVLAVASLLG